MKTLPRLLLLTAATLALAVAAVCIGPTHLLDFSKLTDLLRGAAPTPELERASLVLWQLRLPRVMLAAAAGVNLALGGLLLQSIFRNPLAEPYLLGLSSGGALGAVLALAAGMTAMVWPALAGSLAVAAIVLLLCRRRIASDLPSLLLAGVALGALAQAFTTAIILRFDAGALRSILFWLMGSFAGQGWTAVALTGPAAAVGVLIALFERAVGLYAYLVRINAYNQPGVQAGKVAANDVLEVQQRVLDHLRGLDEAQRLARRRAADLDPVLALRGLTPVDIEHRERRQLRPGGRRTRGTTQHARGRARQHPLIESRLVRDRQGLARTQGRRTRGQDEPEQQHGHRQGRSRPGTS